MGDLQADEQRSADAVALDAIAELFRLPQWRIDDSRVAFLEAVADVLGTVRDLLVVPAAPEFLGQHGWVLLRREGDEFYYDDLYEWRVKGRQCDFCDRRFYPDASGTYRGLGQAFRDDPDSELILLQEICDLCKEERPSGMWPEQLGE